LSKFLSIPIADLRESKQNPRHHFDKQALEDLTESIRTHGVLTPILVRPSNGHFEIGAGHRRYRAAKAAGLAEIPATVRDLSDTELLEVLVIENLQREDVHPLEEAEGYRALIQKAGYDAEAIAAKVGKSASYVYQRLKLAELIGPAKKLFLEGIMTAGHAILLARLRPEDQGRTLKTLFDGPRIAPSVRDLARWIEHEILLDLHAAPWKKDDAQLLPAAGACTACPKRTGFNKALFEDLAKRDLCLDADCYHEKEKAFVARREAELKEQGKKPVRVSSEYLNSYSQEGKPLLKAGVLGNGSYNKISGKPCADARDALVVHGDELGKTFQVCTEPKCKVHGNRYASSYDDSRYRKQQAATKRKAARESERRMAIFAAVVEASARKPGLEEIRLLAGRMLERTMHDDQVRLCKFLELEPPTVRGAYGSHKDQEKPVADLILKANDGELGRLLAALALIGDSYQPPYSTSPPKLLLEAARSKKINVRSIERKLAAAWREEDAKARARKKKAVQTSATKKGGKK